MKKKALGKKKLLHNAYRSVMVIHNQPGMVAIAAIIGILGGFVAYGFHEMLHYAQYLILYKLAGIPLFSFAENVKAGMGLIPRELFFFDSCNWWIDFWVFSLHIGSRNRGTRYRCYD